MMTQENKLLIDRYLENSLTGVELKEFLDKLESSEEFKKEVSFHNLLVEGIHEAEDKRLKDAIEKVINYRKPKIPVALKLILTFMIVTALGISLWNYIGPDSSGKKYDYFTFNFLKGVKKDSTETPPVVEKAVPIKKGSGNKNNVAVADSSTDIKKPEDSDTSSAMFAQAVDIIVKKDQLLISYVLKSINLEQDTLETGETSLTKNTTEKIFPSGGLPDDENKKSENYNVEFWVSPVNYKGYKLIDDKLILFGIEVPDAVQLFSKREKLWMKYGQGFYALKPTEQFESLVLTTEIPEEIK